MNPALVAEADHTKDMAPHLATLQRLANGKRRLVEFGVRTGVSTWAMLDVMATDGRLWSFDTVDVRQTPGHCDLDRFPVRVSSDPRWTLVIGNSASADVPFRPDLLFIDSSHEHDRTLKELAVADRWKVPVIVLHDWNLPAIRDAVLAFCGDGGYAIEGVEDSEWGLVWLSRY